MLIYCAWWEFTRGRGSVRDCASRPSTTPSSQSGAVKSAVTEVSDLR